MVQEVPLKCSISVFCPNCGPFAGVAQPTAHTLVAEIAAVASRWLLTTMLDPFGATTLGLGTTLQLPAIGKVVKLLPVLLEQLFEASQLVVLKKYTVAGCKPVSVMLCEVTSVEEETVGAFAGTGSTFA